MLLRNPYPSDGLCNGTRMIVVRLGQRCIEVQILGGNFDGKRKLIPCILLATTEGELPFILTRKLGLDLRTSPFTHGQLYVAMSRVTDVHS